MKYRRCKECGNMDADGDFCPACIEAHARRGHSSDDWWAGDWWLYYFAAAAVGAVMKFGGRVEKAIVFGLVAWFIVRRFQSDREPKLKSWEEQQKQFEQEQHAMQKLAQKKLAKWKLRQEQRRSSTRTARPWMRAGRNSAPSTASRTLSKDEATPMTQPVRTFRLRPHARIMAALTMLWDIGIVVFALWFLFFLASKVTSYVVVLLTVVYWLHRGRRDVPDALRILFFEVELGTDWIAMRTWRAGRVVLPASEIVEFREVPFYWYGRLWAGHRFLLVGRRGQQIEFSTQVVGWARIIQSLHLIVPWVVPAAAELEARSALKSGEMDPEASAYTAPGQDIPEEWRWVKRSKWYDYFLGFGLAVAIAWVPVSNLDKAINRWGLPSFLSSMVGVVLLVSFASWFAYVYQLWIRRHRIRRAIKAQRR